MDREASFLHFERKNNRLLAALRQPEFSDVLDFIRNRKATIIAPQNVTLTDLPINRSFIETHVIHSFSCSSVPKTNEQADLITIDSEDDPVQSHSETSTCLSTSVVNAFVSVNGVRGVFTTPDKEALHVLAGPPSNPEEVVTLAINPKSQCGPGSVLTSYVADSRDTSDDVYVLRHTMIHIADVEVDFMVISRPLTFDKCPWDLDEFGAGMLLPSDPSDLGMDMSGLEGERGDDLGERNKNHSNATVGARSSTPLVEQLNVSDTAQLYMLDGASRGKIGMHWSDTRLPDSQFITSPAHGVVEAPPAYPKAEVGDGGADLINFEVVGTSEFKRDRGVNAVDTIVSEVNSLSVSGVPPKLVSKETENPDTSRRRRDTSLSTFKESMRDPSCHGFVRMIRAFCEDMTSHPPTVVDMQSRYMAFTVAMEEKFAMHSMFKDDLDNTLECLEKYVCVQTYNNIYRPSEDEEVDTWLGRRIDVLGFLTPEHLEISPHKVSNTVTIEMAGNELKQMNRFKAPRAKLVCVVNCCKIIFRLIQQAGKHKDSGSNDQFASADDLLAILIYVILVTNPMNFKTNLNYIERFRNPRMFVAEQAYYFTTVVSAVEFICRLDENSLNISPQEYDRYITEGEIKWNMNLRRKPDSVDASSTTTGTDKRGSWRSGRNTFIASLQSYVSEVPNILNRSGGLTGSTYKNPGTISPILTSNTSPPPIVAANDTSTQTTARNESFEQFQSESLDRDAVIQYMKSLANNYTGTDPRLRVLNAEDLDFENVPLLLREYQRLAGLADHLMELIQEMP
eukprot:CFRG0299T1